MATDQEFADYVLEQLRDVRGVRHQKMFGEYAVYANERVVALICDNQLFLKPTDAGRALLTQRGTLKEAPPYKGAKPHFLISAELDDSTLLARLVQATVAELPKPKPKKPKSARKATAAVKKAGKKGR
jgi:DNA transformation protein